MLKRLHDAAVTSIIVLVWLSFYGFIESNGRILPAWALALAAMLLVLSLMTKEE